MGEECMDLTGEREREQKREKLPHPSDNVGQRQFLRIDTKQRDRSEECPNQTHHHSRENTTTLTTLSFLVSPAIVISF